MENVHKFSFFFHTDTPKNKDIQAIFYLFTQ